MYPRNPGSHCACLWAGLALFAACGGDDSTGPQGPAYPPMTDLDGGSAEASLPSEGDGGGDGQDTRDGGVEDDGGDGGIGPGRDDDAGMDAGEDDDRDGGIGPGRDDDAGEDAGEEDPDSGPSEAFLRGQALTEMHVCASCHHETFGGNAFYPNISPDVETGIGSWTDEEIEMAVTSGMGKDSEELCGAMPRTDLTPDEVADLIEFLRGVPAVSNAITVQCPVP